MALSGMFLSMSLSFKEVCDVLPSPKEAPHGNATEEGGADEGGAEPLR